MAILKKTLYEAVQVSVLCLLYCLRTLFGRGLIKMYFRFWSQLASTRRVLKVLGANVGANTHIHSDICLYNLDAYSCIKLNIGSNVYIGPRCLFDLTSKITIEDDVSISAQVSFITHLDVGNQPLKQKVPRKEGPIVIHKGAWVGVNSTILHGVMIGEYAMVGAMSLVNKAIPANSLACGNPCKTIRMLNEVEQTAAGTST
jgi:acetyltransferase-like isoleucine patch superfamily enzyme